jgi:hypothetical protein
MLMRNDQRICVTLIKYIFNLYLIVILLGISFYLQDINCTQAKQLRIILKVLYLVGNLVQHGVHICLVALCLKHNMGIPQDFGITTEGEQTLSLGGDALE